MNSAVREDVFLPCLKSLDLFKGQEDELVRFLTTKSDLVSYSKGDLICRKGNQSCGLFCVLDGKVKVAVISHHGNERVMEIVGPGGMFGEAAMFLERSCPVYVQALAKTQVIFLRKAMIVEAMHRFPKFSLALLNGISDRVMRLIRDVEICCLQPAADRVVSFILDNAQPLPGDAAKVVLPAGKAVIASSLNLTPETFSRELHHLADRQFIQIDRRSIFVISLNKLKALSTAGMGG
jgi:CRP-like cAMP-binding protein